MAHGSQHYFDECARFAARLSRITAAVAAVILAMLVAVQNSPLRELMNDPEHFGFEGPDRYVQRIELEAYGPMRDSPNLSRGLEYVPRASRGGGIGRDRQRVRMRADELALGPAGPGDSPVDLLARAMSRSSNVPLVQSEQLVFERLVRPDYPEEARARGIEGRFFVLALIDTSGRVVEVQLQGGDPNGLLEREALASVRLCLIKPYRTPRGDVREIVARFPFNFYLRD